MQIFFVKSSELISSKLYNLHFYCQWTETRILRIFNPDNFSFFGGWGWGRGGWEGGSKERDSEMKWVAMREKCPYLKFFWSVFSCIRSEYGEILRTSPYLVRMRENMDQKNSESGVEGI